ncbi:SulP family inorganic anion transporter [Salsuginibacillus kocurii]|uniref:SulP family inorganic anion transporter n=1 Tax=Salsuginibacillus kocurii TaxID=427078 RepID=UPI0003787814|nr:sulfate permease [Salsuginibacillus kocurii]
MLQKWLPGLQPIVRQNKHGMKQDINAGLIVAIMLVPQGMAYAQLAGMPAVTGLYAATFPLLVYAIFGTSRQLSVGPVAMIALLTFSGVSPLAETGSATYIQLVWLLALMIAVLQVLMGILKMGIITRFISDAVISGFTSAAAVLIALSQSKHLLGISVETGDTIYKLANGVIENVEETHIPTLILGLSLIVVLFLSKKIPKLPGQLAVVVIGIIVVATMDLEGEGVAIVGAVPEGLPPLSMPPVEAELLWQLLPTALTIAVIGYAESFAMGKILAMRGDYRIAPNHELKGLGLANGAAAFTSGMPVTGAFSRSAVNYEAGAKTNLASIVTALLIMLTLLFFMPLFYHLPQAALAAIIIAAVFKLIDIKKVLHLWNVKRSDAATLLLTFVATLSFGIKLGLVAGIIFSLALYIWQSAYPHITELHYIKTDNKKNNHTGLGEGVEDSHVLIYRIEASLYFANLTSIEEQINKTLQKEPNTKWLVFDFSSVNGMDGVAADTLMEWMEEWNDQGLRAIIVSAKKPVREVMNRAGFYDTFRAEVTWHDVEEAVEWIEAQPVKVIEPDNDK